MAASATKGPKGQPRFPANEAPDLGVDEELLADYSALVGNRKVGTTAQRLAATGVDVWDGLLWGDTTDRADYKYTSGGWKVAGGIPGGVPFAMAAGTTQPRAASPGSSSITDITFPTGRFSTAPLVVATNAGAVDASGFITVQNITATGCRLVHVVPGSSAQIMAANWIATQMTPTAAAG